MTSKDQTIQVLLEQLAAQTLRLRRWKRAEQDARADQKAANDEAAQYLADNNRAGEKIEAQANTVRTLQDELNIVNRVRERLELDNRKLMSNSESDLRQIKLLEDQLVEAEHKVAAADDAPLLAERIRRLTLEDIQLETTKAEAMLFPDIRRAMADYFNHGDGSDPDTLEGLG